MNLLVLLTKADKLSNNKREEQLIQVRKKLFLLSKLIRVGVSSSLNKQGVDIIKDTLTYWYQRFKSN